MKKELLLSLLETNARYSTRDLADVLLEDEESVIHTMSDLEKKRSFVATIQLSTGKRPIRIRSWH